MKKFGLTLLSLMLVCCFFMVGCSWGGTKLIVDLENPSTGFEKLQKIDMGENATVESEITDRGYTVVKTVVEGKTKYGVFSVIENKQTLDYMDVDSLMIFSSEYADYALTSKTENEVTTDTLMSLTGEVVFEATSIELSKSAKFGNVVYEQWDLKDKDGNALAILHKIKGDNRKELARINVDTILSSAQLRGFACMEFGPSAEKLLVAAADSSYGNTIIRFYNFEGELERETTLSFTNLDAMMPFGKYSLLQYKIEVDSMSEKYDTIEEGVKYNYETYRVNLLNGDKKKIKTDFVAVQDASLEYNFDADAGIATLRGSVYKIVDKQLQEVAMLIVSDDCTKIEEVGYDYSYIVRLNKNRFVAESTSGAIHIIDAKYKFIAELSNYIIIGYADEFIAIQNINDKVAIIDFNGKVIKPFKKYADVVGVSNNLLVVVEEIKDVKNNKTINNVITIDKTGAERVLAYSVNENATERYYFQNNPCDSLVDVNGTYVVNNTHVYSVDGTLIGSLVDATKEQIEDAEFTTFGENNEYCVCEVGSTGYLVY